MDSGSNKNNPSSGQRSADEKGKQEKPGGNPDAVVSTKISIAGVLRKSPTTDRLGDFKLSPKANPELMGLLTRPAAPPTPKPDRGE